MPGFAVRILLLGMVLVGCDARRSQTPDWARSAPAGTVTAISCRADWALRQPHFKVLLERFPLAGRALDALLQRARIDPRQEAGRLTVYLCNPPGPGNHLPPDFLLQLGGFPDPGTLMVAMADAFPSDGSLPMANRELPVFSILELKPDPIRAMADSEGRLWLGDLASLARLGSGRVHAWNRLAASVDWLSGTWAIQGFIRPPGLLQCSDRTLPGDLARDLPRGIESLAWGVAPGADPDPLNGFELSMAGSHGAILRAAPWLQRFLAAAQAAGGPSGGGAQAPEILQERWRIGLRCQLTRAQVDAAMARLNLPAIPWP